MLMLHHNLLFVPTNLDAEIRQSECSNKDQKNEQNPMTTKTVIRLCSLIIHLRNVEDSAATEALVNYDKTAAITYTFISKSRTLTSGSSSTCELWNTYSPK